MMGYKKEAFNFKSLINELKREYPELSDVILEKAVDAVFDEMSTGLVCGDRVEIRGFGSFIVRKRAKGKVRNPKTGEVLDKKNSSGYLYFRASRELTEELNS
jgi:integration host factor subunit beta